ncbi:MAG: hypothetical protein WBA93_30395 [Microcoleaceae cyanobacterium]
MWEVWEVWEVWGEIQKYIFSTITAAGRPLKLPLVVGVIHELPLLRGVTDSG